MQTIIKIKRQQSPDSPSYWEDFKVSTEPAMSVADALAQIRWQSTNLKGEKVGAVSWDEACAGEHCTTCLSLINQEPKPLCATKIAELKQPIRLEPLTKFPVLKDLLVDKTRLFSIGFTNLQRVEDFSRTRPIQYQQATTEVIDCTHCGACLEACPRYHDQSPFRGAHAMLHNQELKDLTQAGGIHDCGLSQNCVTACPEKIPLADVFIKLKGRAFRSFFS